MFSRPIGCATLVEQAQNWVDKAFTKLSGWCIAASSRQADASLFNVVALQLESASFCNKQARNTKGMNYQYALPASNYRAMASQSCCCFCSASEISYVRLAGNRGTSA